MSTFIRSTIITRIGIAITLAFSASSQAATYCVNSDTALISALYSATASPENDEIRVVKGSMNLGTAIEAGQKIEGDLALRGGYAAGCATRPDIHAISTITAAATSIRLFPRQQSNITIERMAFSGHSSFSIVDNMAEYPGKYGLILITRSAFRNADVGLWVGALRHDVRVENSLFINNAQNSGSMGLIIATYYNPSTQQDSKASVVNCTLRGNSFGLWVDQGSLSSASPIPSVVNTISAENTIDVVLSRPTEIRSSMFASLSITDTGGLTSASSNNLASDPQLDAKHRPRAGSRAINSGDNAAVVSAPFNPALDYYGDTRIVAQVIDRGAVETSAFPWLGF